MFLSILNFKNIYFFTGEGSWLGENRYVFISLGCSCLGLGFTLLVIICACQTTRDKKRRPPGHLMQVGHLQSPELNSGNEGRQQHSNDGQSHDKVYFIEHCYP